MYIQKTWTAGFLQLVLCAFFAIGICAHASSGNPIQTIDGIWVESEAAHSITPGKTNTFKFKVEGDKVTGKVIATGTTSPKKISDLKTDGKEVSFSVDTELNGKKVTQKFSGTVTKDSIKGKVEYAGEKGAMESHDWEVKRKDKAK